MSRRSRIARSIFFIIGISFSLIASILGFSPSTAVACTPNETTYENSGTVYTVLSFSQSQSGCDWTPPVGLTQVDALLVAGGGGGGSRIGGGGGGGEVRFIENQSVTPSTTYSVVVGAGGNGGTVDASANGSTGSDGGSSSIFGTTVAGGGGGGSLGGTTAAAGKSGGSGGGGSCTSGNNFGASFKLGSGLGNDGGLGFNGGGSACVAGGGGGAGTAGGAANGTTQSGGAGGNGSSFSITSTIPTIYGGGGGGGLNAGTGAISAGTPGAGGSGGGGSGGPKNTANGPVDGLAGTDGLGGGGGGASNHFGTFTAATSGRGGDGGDGIVIIRYIAPPRFLKVGEDTDLNQNPVLLVDPRSISVPIPFLRLNTATNSRICVDLFTNSTKNANIELKNNSAASSFHRLAISNSASGITSVEGVTVNSSTGMKLTGNRSDVVTLLNPAVSANESYLRLYKPDSGWVDGSVLRIRADYATGSDCSGVSGSEVAVDAQIKIVGLDINQRNEVSVN